MSSHTLQGVNRAVEDLANEALRLPSQPSFLPCPMTPRSRFLAAVFRTRIPATVVIGAAVVTFVAVVPFQLQQLP